MLPTYKPSGKFNVSIVLLLPLLLAVAVGAAAIYEWLIRLVPFIMLDCLICVGFAGLLGYLTGYALRLSKVRNVPISIILGLFVGVAGFLAAHYFGYLMDTQGQPGQFTIPEYIKARVHQGFSIGKRSSSTNLGGWAVYAIWGIEACIIVGGAAVGALNAAQTAFCESCGLWANNKICELEVPRPGAAAVESVKAAATIPDVLAVEPAPVGSGADGKSILYKVEGCPGCTFAAMQVTVKTVTTDKKGKSSTSTDRLHNNLLLTPDEVELVKSIKSEAERAGDLAAAPTSLTTSSAAPDTAPSASSHPH